MGFEHKQPPPSPSINPPHFARLLAKRDADIRFRTGYGDSMNHPTNLAPLLPLIGRWVGPGAGEYPTISSFEYSEELTFADIGKPFLTYIQRTWSPTGAPMHTETGFVRVPAPGVVEMILAQPTGQSELLEGTWEEADDGVTIALTGRILNSGSAKTVDATQREYVLSLAPEADGAPAPRLATRFAMAAVGVPMTHHLASELVPAEGH